MNEFLELLEQACEIDFPEALETLKELKVGQKFDNAVDKLLDVIGKCVKDEDFRKREEKAYPMTPRSFVSNLLGSCLDYRGRNDKLAYADACYEAGKLEGILGQEGLTDTQRVVEINKVLIRLRKLGLLPETWSCATPWGKVSVRDDEPLN